MTSPGHLDTHRPKPCHIRAFLEATPHHIKCVKIRHVSQLKCSAGFQFIFWKLPAQCSAISAEVDSWRVTRKVVDSRKQPASELSFALDPCSDSPLLGVSAVKLGLIPGSPISLFFKLASGSSQLSSDASI